jgi:hypothetical protein
MPQPGLEQRSSRRRPFFTGDQRFREFDESTRIFSATLDQVAPQALPLCRFERRQRLQPRIRPVVAGKGGNLETMRHRRRMQAFQCIGEIAGASQGTHDDQLGMPRHPRHEGINRHRVLEIGQAREPPFEPAGHLPGRGNAGKFRVRRTEKQDVTRRLSQVDGFVAIAQASLLCNEEMHCAYPANAARLVRIAVLSRSCRPMTTSLVCRVSPPLQGRSKWVSMRLPTA